MESPQVIALDHLAVIAPTLTEGVAYVEDCLRIEVPFGTRHNYMGTHNHRLQLGRGVYLEIVALDPEGVSPGRARWFGLDDQDKVRADWEARRRLRGWVASTDDIPGHIAAHPDVFGAHVPLPPQGPTFAFAIPDDGSLPLDGAAPSLIDRRGATQSMAVIPDRDARLRSVAVEHPDPPFLDAFYRALSVDRPPDVQRGLEVRYRAVIETATGVKEMT